MDKRLVGWLVCLTIMGSALPVTGWSGWLGMAVRPPVGAEVEELVPGGPAQLAGVRPGDQILAVNGLVINSVAQLTGLLANLPVGAPITLQLWRSGETLNIQTSPTLPPAHAPAEQPAPAAGNPVWLGIHVTADPAGLLISGVALESPAHRAGLRRHDILLRINGTAITSPEMLNTLVSQQYPGTPVALDILRDGHPMGMKVDLVVRPSGR